jgi:hypothetical protein
VCGVFGCAAFFLQVPIRGVRRVDWMRASSARTRNWERHRVTLIDTVWLKVATTSSMLDVIICGFNQPLPALKSSILNGCQLLECLSFRLSLRFRHTILMTVAISTKPQIYSRFYDFRVNESVPCTTHTTCNPPEPATSCPPPPSSLRSNEDNR